MRVVYLVTRADAIGGAQTHVLQLSEALLTDGGTPYGITGAGQALASKLSAVDVPYRSFTELRRKIAPYHDVKLRREVASQEPDLIGCHSSKAGVLGRLIGNKLRIPTIFTSAHGWRLPRAIPRAQRVAYRAIERLPAPLAQRIVTVCEAAPQLALNCQPPLPIGWSPVHNGAPDVPGSLIAKPQSSSCKLVTVARLESPKRIDLALEALTQIAEHPWHFSTIGDGPPAWVARDASEESGYRLQSEFPRTN